MAQHRVAQPAQLVDQRTRRDDVAEPQRRRQALRDRADVDHAAALVEALQRRHRRAGVQVLGFVVVFDDDEIALLGQAQQAVPALEAQRRGGRALVRRRHVEVVEIGQAVDDDAFGIDRRADPLRASAAKSCCARADGRAPRGRPASSSSNSASASR